MRPRKKPKPIAPDKWTVAVQMHRDPPLSADEQVRLDARIIERQRDITRAIVATLRNKPC